VGEEKFRMTDRTQVDRTGLSGRDPLIAQLVEDQGRKIQMSVNGLPPPKTRITGRDFRKNLLTDLVATTPRGWPQNHKKVG
jgi:hypothetical protein